MFHHLFWLKVVNKEHNSLAIFIKKIFSKVPFNVVFGSLLLEILEEWAGVVADHLLLFDHGERDLICFEKPGPNLLVRIRLFFSKLVAGNCDDSQTPRIIFVVHLLVLAIVLISESSLRSDIDNDRGLSTSVCFVCVNLLDCC